MKIFCNIWCLLLLFLRRIHVKVVVIKKNTNRNLISSLGQNSIFRHGTTNLRMKLTTWVQNLLRERLPSAAPPTPVIICNSHNWLLDPYIEQSQQVWLSTLVNTEKKITFVPKGWALLRSFGSLGIRPGVDFTKPVRPKFLRLKPKLKFVIMTLRT
jgi:hypothetical protein